MSRPPTPPLPDGFERFDARLGEVRLSVVAGGPRDGRLVVFLHGFPEHWRSFRHQIEHFARRGFRVLAPDQRGYGLSDKPRRVSAYRPRRLAADVTGLIEHAGRERALVVGHDWGAMAAWWTTLLSPERVEALAILNVPHPAVMRRHLLTDFRQLRRSWYIFFFQLPWLPERFLRRDDFAAAERSLLATSRRGTFDERDLAAYREAWSQPGALRGMLAWYRAALRFPAFRLPDPRVRRPTLMLWGLRDRFLGREMIQPSLDLCDDARLETFGEATHWLQHEEPDAVNTALERFFDEVEASRP